MTTPQAATAEPQPSTPPAATAEPQQPTPQAAPTPAPAADVDWKAQAQKWEQRSKENFAAAQKLAAIEESQKTESQKAAEALAAAQREAQEARSEVLRLKVAGETGLPPALVEFLPSGVDEDTLRAKAALLMAQVVPAGPSRPAPDPAQGAKPDSLGPSQLTRADLARMTPEQIDKAIREGRFADLLAGRQT